MVSSCIWMGTARCRRTSGNERRRMASTHVPAVRGRLNLRRRGLAGDRPGRKFCGVRGCSCDSFAFPADASVPAIFKNYTTFGEFLADAVGGGEVAALAGGVALGDAFFDFGVAQGVGFLVVAQAARFGGAVVFEAGEPAVAIFEELFGRGTSSIAN